jgi:hypothetical protein
MGDASGDAAQVPPQVARLWEKGKSTVVQNEAKAIVKLMKEKGITLEDLLAGLDEERAAIYDEQYGDEAQRAF